MDTAVRRRTEVRRRVGSQGPRQIEPDRASRLLRRAPMTERDVRKYWEAEADRYAATAYQYQAQQDRVRYPFYEIRRQRVLELLEPLSRGRLLDAGCGGAELLVAALGQGWDGFGFDFAENMVKLARGRLE